MRHFTILLCLCSGCRMWQVPQPESGTSPAAPDVIVEAEPVVAEVPEEFAEDGLTLAARCLDAGDHDGAVAHLESHIDAFPDQVMIRAYLAELLNRIGRADAAASHFERFIAEAQHLDGGPREHLTHCHTRLMEIAIARGDSHAEHLHRGIGLLRLAATAPGELMREEILCKAMKHLNVARKADPDSARAERYLHRVYDELGQAEPAADALARAKDKSTFSTLTPAESAALHLKSLPG